MPDAGVLDLDVHACSRARTRGARREPRARVLRRVLAEVAQRLLEQVAVDARRRAPSAHSTSTATPSCGRRLVRDLAQQRRERDRLDARPLLPGVRARERQQRAGEPRQPRRLALDVAEEAVALGGILLRARLEHLDRADDRRQRRAQLVRRVRDELALGELAPLLLGQVVEHDQRRVALGLGRDARRAPSARSSSGRDVRPARATRPLVEQPLRRTRAATKPCHGSGSASPSARRPPSSRRASAFAKWTTRSWST